MPSEKSKAPYVPRTGDKVRTPDGDGYVSAVAKWQHLVGEMTEAEASEFGRVCLAQYGKDWQKIWFRAYVTIAGVVRWYEKSEIEMLETGRTY